MNKTDPLIRTKLHLPRTRTELVPRPRLQNRIAEGLRLNPLTLVIAPAGFGKTTLVTASLAGCNMGVAWLSLDRDENQISRFLAYLLAALQSADTRIGNEAAQIMSGMHQALPSTVMTSLINDMDTSNKEMILVLDDYQYISNPEVHDAVAFLLDHCPHTFHLMIATRSDPPLPLARLRARGQMVELRAADLRFTGDEAIHFLNDVMGLRLDASAAAILEERTEGWVAGLQMAALSMRDRGDVQGFIAGFSGTNRHILDYLLEEIMAGQSPEIQHFLLYTSILERLTASLCDAVLTDDEQPIPNYKDEKSHSGKSSFLKSASILEYLEKENLFLVSLDDERIWFRYHHLFNDLLRARLQQAQSDFVPRLHIRASDWLAKHGLITEAIHHLLSAREFDRAADMIERHGPACLAQNDLSVFQMADKLPPEILITRSKIGLYHVWHLILHGNIKKALPLMTDMARQFDSANPDSKQRWKHTFIASALAFLSPQTSIPDVNPLPDIQLLDEIPAEEQILRNAADFLYGMALARRGELDRAVEVSIKCIQREKLQQGKLVIPTLAPFLTRLYLIQGRLHTAAALCHEFLDPIKEKGIRFFYTSGSMKIDLGEVMYEWNYLDEAEQYIQDGLQGNEPWQNIMTDGFGLIALTHVLRAKGNFTEATRTVEKFESILQSRSQPREFDEDLYTLRVRIQLDSGDLRNPSLWADQIQHGEDFILHKERYLLTLARIRLAQGRYDKVEETLAGTTPSTSPGSRTARQLEFNLLLAAAFSGQQRQQEAYDLLESCLALAEPEGYTRVFMNIGKPVQDLMTAYLRSESTGHRIFAQKVLDAYTPSRGAGSAGSQPTGLIEPLSERELEVLNLIALGKTNEEIARQLVVARGTIKAHAASIYRKLDVDNRTEAVARARQQGVLP